MPKMKQYALEALMDAVYVCQSEKEQRILRKQREGEKGKEKSRTWVVKLEEGIYTFQTRSWTWKMLCQHMIH